MATPQGRSYAKCYIKILTLGSSYPPGRRLLQTVLRPRAVGAVICRDQVIISATAFAEDQETKFYCQVLKSQQISKMKILKETNSCNIFYTEFYMNFYLNLTITKFYLYYHVPLPYLPGKANSLSLFSQNPVAGKLVAQVVPDQGIHPVQTSCDQVYIHTLTFSIACYIWSRISTPSP